MPLSCTPKEKACDWLQVRSSPVDSKRSFLEKKGLTPQEIAEAFKRVPDTPSASAPTAPSGLRRSIQGSTPRTSTCCEASTKALSMPPSGGAAFGTLPSPDSTVHPPGACMHYGLLLLRLIMAASGVYLPAGQRWTMFAAGSPSAPPPKPYPTATAEALQQLVPAPLQQPQPIRWTQVANHHAPQDLPCLWFLQSFLSCCLLSWSIVASLVCANDCTTDDTSADER